MGVEGVWVEVGVLSGVWFGGYIWGGWVGCVLAFCSLLVCMGGLVLVFSSSILSIGVGEYTHGFVNLHLYHWYLGWGLIVGGVHAFRGVSLHAVLPTSTVCSPPQSHI